MIKMFSKNRSSRRKDKNRDESSNTELNSVAQSSGSVNLSQAEMLYGSNTSPARSTSIAHNPGYCGVYGNGMMDRPPRGRAMSDGSPADFPAASPLDFPLEHLQSFNATYGLNPSQRTYIDSRPVPRHTPLKTLISPTHTRSVGSNRTNLISQNQSHIRTGSSSSLGNSLRDRSLDRIERENVYLGDASLDRHFEQIQYSMQMDNRLNHDTRYNTTGRDRSLDREYPHMGARSLERDPHSVTRSRSTDRGGEYAYPSATLPTMPLLSHPSSMQPDHSSNEFRNSLVFEMQIQISDLHKEVSRLQKDLDQTREKLSSSMNSIKTFWSPELKKERAVRKEEAARCSLLNEQLKVTQAELKRHRELLKEMEDKTQSNSPGTSAGSVSSQIIAQEVTMLRQEREVHSREMLILKKTLEELEIRIESQKQTLDARDESIKKLLEMLHNKGVNTSQVEEDRKDLERLRTHLREEEQKRKLLEEDVAGRDARIVQLEMELSRFKDNKIDSHGLSGDYKLQAMLEAKDSRINDLESEVQQLEDKLLKAKEDSAGLMSSNSRETSFRELASAKEKLLNIEIQAMKSEISKKETEMASLLLKVETLERQQSEREDYLAVLKDQVASKDRQTSMLQADIEGLQERIKNKDGTIERKNKESSVSQAEKRRLELDVLELKDQLEIKASRVSSLQRKIESLEDTIREKEDQLSQARVRLTSTFTESPSDSTLSALEETIAEKDKQIERLKEQRDLSEKEHQEEIDIYIKKAQELKSSLDNLQKDITTKQTEICELREKTTELQAKKFEQDGKIRKLESELQERRTDFQRVTLELEEAKQQISLQEKHDDESKKKETSQPANLNKQESKHLEAEIDRLQDMLKEAEADKVEKENELKDLREQVKEYKQKMGTLKRNQQTEKKKNAQLLEEARKREDSMTDDASHLSTVIKKSNDRVEELEEALRQSVIITAEREMAMAELQGQIEDAKAAMDEMHAEMEQLQQTSQEYEEKLSAVNKQVEDRDVQLKKFAVERQKQLQEIYEMKQEAIQAAISEKDSTLALLEMTSTKNQKNMEEIDRLTQEKHKLQSQLREVTAKRMRLMQRESSNGGSEDKSASVTVSPVHLHHQQPTMIERAESAGSSPFGRSPSNSNLIEDFVRSSTSVTHHTPSNTDPFSVDILPSTSDVKDS